MAQPSVTGITAQAISARIIVSIGRDHEQDAVGARRDDLLLHEHLQRVGKGLQKMPQNPTTFGPFRNCMAPSTLRSATVK